jgi:hypothetical protein
MLARQAYVVPPDDLFVRAHGHPGGDVRDCGRGEVLDLGQERGSVGAGEVGWWCWLFVAANYGRAKANGICVFTHKTTLRARLVIVAEIAISTHEMSTSGDLECWGKSQSNLEVAAIERRSSQPDT